tara:strand:+ start:217 stop:483 length:267 start_codon:yes stop_codon:yes gene_type:complete
MYTIELTLRYSPFPMSIQKKEYEQVSNIFNDIKNAMQGNSNDLLINLNCDKVKDKSIAVLAREVIAIQIYEKSAVAGGSKRPGFTLDG